MEIEKLITQPESKTLEFKSDLSSLEPILKTVVAFANTAGGTLIIGLSPAGDLLGVEDVFKAEEKLANTIADSILPSILPEIEIATLHGKNLLVLKISYWKGPFYLKKLGLPNGVYVRLGSTSRPAGLTLIEEMQRSILRPSFDEEALSDLSADDIELDKAKQFFLEVKKDLDEKKLQSLKILVPSARGLVLSIGGLILFGKQEIRQRFLPDARVSCARFRGTDKTEIIDRYEVEGTILYAADEVPKFIMRNTRLSAEILDIRRKDIAEYSPIAVREVLINALAHCDYSVTGSRIQIAIFSDRLEIQNPGMLPFGFTLEDLKTGVSRVRNRVIVRVFNELNLMEEWGSGYKRIIEACHSGGYPEPEWQELGSCVRVIFYPHTKTTIEEPNNQASRALEDLSVRQQAILNLFAINESLPFREILERLSPKISERSLRYDLSQLQTLKLLSAKGKGRALVWLRLK